MNGNMNKNDLQQIVLKVEIEYKYWNKIANTEKVGTALFEIADDSIVRLVSTRKRLKDLIERVYV